MGRYDNSTSTPTVSFANKFLFGTGIVAVLVSLFAAGQMFETNMAGYVQVKQAAGTGTMTVQTTPGVYWQGFGTINTYKISDVYDFNDNGSTINVRFSDASTADISGQIKFRLPNGEDKILQINQDFRSYENVENDLIRQVVAASLRQTASLFTSEEVYSTRRADFVALVNSQIQNGIYATNYTEAMVKDEDGNASIARKVNISLGKDGQPVISEPSTFKRYGVELVQLVINDISFDEATQKLIAKRKEADQEKVVAKAKAERAKQDALTAEAQGKANVATAEAEALVKKKTAVIAAEQAKEVAQQEALKAEQEKLAIVARGEAEARAAQLKVAAGLTPLDRANIEKETKVEIAKALATVKFPERMIISGGGGSSGSVNPFDAVGLKAMYDLSEKMAGSEGSKE